MSLPIPEKRRARKRKADTVKIKLPSTMQSKNWPKCPICRAPFKQKCLSCGYINKEGNITSELFIKGGQV